MGHIWDITIYHSNHFHEEEMEHLQQNENSHAAHCGRKRKEGERSAQAKERTRLKRKSESGDKGANSASSAVMLQRRKPEKIHHGAGYASRAPTPTLAAAARVHVIHPISYVL